MHLPTFRLVLLVLLVLISIAYILTELWQWNTRKRLRKERIQKAHKEWVELANSFAEWRSKNKFHNFEHPHYQWFLRQEEMEFEHYLNVKEEPAERKRGFKRERGSKKEKAYLNEIRNQIRDIRFAEPPEMS